MSFPESFKVLVVGSSWASIAEHIQALAPHAPFHVVVDATGALTINRKLIVGFQVDAVGVKCCARSHGNRCHGNGIQSEVMLS